jgi:DNA-binding NarL/FixJ family response regulator
MRPVRAAEPTRLVLILTTPGAVSDSLIYALERELPWVVVRQLDDVAAACTAFEYPVSLILVDPSLVRAAEEAASELLEYHPQSLTAVIDLDAYQPTFSLSDIFSSRLIRGVLPMNLKLDIWLSVVRLLIKGGEYFPAGMLQSYMNKPRELIAPPPGGKTRRPSGGLEVQDLTPRELQVLEMVARGLQNKVIAAEFSLSEHTVKIHLHNIITKLGAHNRTEAAARFRDHFANGYMLAQSR